MMSFLRWTMVALGVCLVIPATAGGEQLPRRQIRATRTALPPGRAIERSAIRPNYGQGTGRNMPLPAPYHAPGSGAELNEFYGPTYYYPSAHNMYEGLHPTYYPFLLPDQKAANYKVGGLYCPGQLCGSSRSGWYWDSYDDWVRGGRYEQHQ